jgi:hypothetical protein
MCLQLMHSCLHCCWLEVEGLVRSPAQHRAQAATNKSATGAFSLFITISYAAAVFSSLEVEGLVRLVQ